MINKKVVEETLEMLDIKDYRERLETIIKELDVLSDELIIEFNEEEYSRISELFLESVEQVV